MKTRLLTLLAIGFSFGAAAQNVGIGTSSFTPDASSILELRSTDGGFLMPRMTEAQRDAISSPASGLMIYQTNNAPGYYYYDGSAWQTFGVGSADNFGDHVAQQNIIVGQGLGIVDTDEDTKIQVEENTDDDHIRFDVAGSEAMLIDNAQNVGVGTSTPSEKLHVEGNIRVGSGAYLDDDATAGGNNDDWVRLNGFVEVKSNTDNQGLVIRDKDNDQYVAITQKNGWSYFSDNNSSSNYFLRGNGSNVDVRGDIRVLGSDVYDNSGNLRLSGEDNVFITMDYNNNDADSRSIRFGKNNMGSPTELMRIDEDGNVGIGVTNPTSTLQVAGRTSTETLRVTNGAANGLVLTSDASGNATWQPVESDLIDNDGDTQVQVEESSDEDRIRFDVSGVQAMMIDNDGNVGVGTTSPDGKLTVGGTNSDGEAVLHLQSGNNNTQFNNGAQIAFGYNGSDNFSHFIHTRHSSGTSNNNAIDFYTCNGTASNSVTSGSNHVMSLNGQRVGIGVQNPSYRLHVTESNTNLNVVEFINTSNQGLVQFNDNLSSTNGYHAMESWTNKSTSWGAMPFGVYGGSYSSVSSAKAGGVNGHANNRNGYGVLGSRGSTGGAGYAGLFLGKLGYSGGITNLSDRRLKRDIENLDNALEIVESLRATTYYFDTEKHADFGLSETLQYGFIAQEIEEVLPEIVLDAMIPGLAKQRERKDGKTEVEVGTFKSYDFPQLIPILTKAIQEQQDIIEEMENKNNELEARLEAIEARLK